MLLLLRSCMYSCNCSITSRWGSTCSVGHGELRPPVYDLHRILQTFPHSTGGAQDVMMIDELFCSAPSSASS